MVRPQPSTALASDMAMSHCRPLLILRSMYMGYFHMTCCRVKSSSTLYLCDDASGSKVHLACLFLIESGGFNPMFALSVLPQLSQNIQRWGLKVFLGCRRAQQSECNQLSLQPLSGATLNSIFFLYWNNVKPPGATCKKQHHFTLVLEYFKCTVNCSLVYSRILTSTKPLFPNKTQLDIYLYPGGQLTI